MIKLPAIIVNFKTYDNSTGQEAVNLAKICSRVSQESKVPIIVAVQAADIFQVVDATNIPVFAQHIDPVDPGKNTGFVLPKTVKDAGAIGTLLNHAEHKLSDDILKKSIEYAKKEKLISLVCAENVEVAKKVAKFNPDIIAVEVPELIGGKISIATAKPSLIINAVKSVEKIKKIPVLAGAGVHDANDVARSLEFGTKGVLLASAITTAKDPEKVLLDLINGFKK